MFKKTVFLIASILCSTQIFGMQNDYRSKEKSYQKAVKNMDDFQKSQDFIQAIIENNADKVNQLIAANVDINAPFDLLGIPGMSMCMGNTPLMAAINFNRKEIAEILLKQENIQVNAKNFLGSLLD